MIRRGIKPSVSRRTFFVLGGKYGDCIKKISEKLKKSSTIAVFNDLYYMCVESKKTNIPLVGKKKTRLYIGRVFCSIKF